jgi:hypothetical protein
MKTFARIFFCILFLTVALPGAAQAQEAKNFAVLPFEINGPQKYQYLSRGIQDMLTSRLSWAGHMEPVGKDATSDAAEPENIQGAVSMLKSLAADYLIWGSVTVVEDQASLDVNVTADNGKNWTESTSVPMSRLIPELERIATRINDEIFNRKVRAADESPEKQEARRPANPELLYSQQEAAPGQGETLNPQFRSEGGASTQGRQRSSSLPFAARGLICADLDSDGNNDLVFIDKSDIAVYRYHERRLKLLDKFTAPSRIELLNLNIIDMNRDGIMEIAVSGMQDIQGKKNPSSMILNFKSGKLEIIEDRLSFYLNVFELPPTYKPTLVGQKKGSGRIFGGSVSEVVRMSGGYDLGKGIALPDEANIFNVSYLPISLEDYKILVVSDRDKLLVYTKTLERQYASEEEYAGSSVGFKYPDTFPGLGTREGSHELSYYVPLRLVTVNLNDDKAHELLVNKNISVAAQFFKHYRYFPQGEIHALFWDGIGMSLAWKTRRIKGTVMDYGINDVDDNGTMDLYICVVTHPGTLGLEDRKTYVVTYPLDLEKKIKPAY